MTFRTRLVLGCTAAVALVIALAVPISYAVVRNQLRGEVDSALRERIRTLGGRPLFVTPGGVAPDGGIRFPAPRFGGAGGYLQIVTVSSGILRPPGETTVLPVSEDVRAVAAGQRGAYFSDISLQGTHLRMYTAPAGTGAAVQIVRPLTEVDSVLGRVGLYLGIVAACGLGLAALLAWIVARQALIPVRRLSDATEHVAETHDLSGRIDVGGRDELSRLAASFNTMLGELEESERAQRALVADASHELRTPLTSIRTNVEVLARSEGELAPEERERTFADVVVQLSEMGILIEDLLALARGQQPSRSDEDVRLDVVAAELAERYSRRAPGLHIRTELDESLVRGDPSSLERAVGNLLDNAVKWSPEGGEIAVTVHGAEVTVRDHGPGVASEDAPHVFDRFYRAPAARGLPGSGLGLAIVKQVAEAHGGSVSVETPPDGGTLVRLRLLPDS